MNPVIGEREIELGGHTYLARPDFQAISLAESLAGTSILKISDRIHDGDARIQDVTSFLFACIKSGEGDGLKLNFQQVGSTILMEGVVKHAITAVTIIGQVLNPPAARKKNEPEAPAEKSTGASGSDAQSLDSE